ncbi:helix-turn-helix transcriptional regulator [Paenibacillus ginsengarvi]|uniref:WYL domain-containing protein n=1 Tax=Paenibacillus ginsengarvi TaxID=400777 RepID=A0A3B0CFN5_9BACL|nr:WYL domain-containing protein [Paenibacillus ginsengarvi]
MDRLMAIMIALQQRTETAQMLADKLEVSRRTIIRDMQSLAEIGVPVYSVSGPAGGYRLMEGFRLPPLQLDPEEALTVLFALRAMTRLSDTPFNQARWTAIDKIKAVLPQQTLQQIEPMLDYVELEVPERQVKTPFLSPLLAYAAKGATIRALYRSERHRRWLTLKPLKVQTSRGFWYVSAYSDTHGEERTFRVDRFEALEQSEPGDSAAAEGLEAPKKKRADEAKPPVRIVARLTYRGALLAEQDEHIGEIVKMTGEDEWELDFACPSSEWAWAVRFFYTLGMDAEVLSPPSLRVELRRKAEEMSSRYGPGESPV